MLTKKVLISGGHMLKALNVTKQMSQQCHIPVPEMYFGTLNYCDKLLVTVKSNLKVSDCLQHYLLKVSVYLQFFKYNVTY